MAKKTKEVAAPVAAIVLTDAVTASVALESVEVDAETGSPVDVLIVTLSKGKLMPEAQVRFQAAAEGVTGKVAASVKAALNSLLDALKIHPDAFTVPTSVKFAEVGGNEPKEAESFDELSDDEKTDMRDSLSSFAGDVADYRNATRRTLEATLTVSRSFAGIMSRFTTKKRRGIFVKLAGETAVTAVAEGWPNAGDLKAVADMVTSKNVPAELLFMAALPESLLALLPEGKASPKAAQAWVAGMRSALAAEMVGVIKRDEELSDASATEAFWAAAEEPFSFDAATLHLLALHLKNMPVGGMFDVDGSGKLSVAKVDGKFVAVSLFGTEGADELLKAFCAAFNGYRTEAEKEADKAARETAKPVASRDFSSLPVADVALHLFRILSGRVDETTEETLDATCGDCAAIVAAVGDMVAAIASGEKTLADILNGASDAPSDEGAAENDADAAA